MKINKLVLLSLFLLVGVSVPLKAVNSRAVIGGMIGIAALGGTVGALVGLLCWSSDYQRWKFDRKKTENIPQPLWYKYVLGGGALGAAGGCYLKWALGGMPQRCEENPVLSQQPVDRRPSQVTSVSRQASNQSGSRSTILRSIFVGSRYHDDIDFEVLGNAFPNSRFFQNSPSIGLSTRPSSVNPQRHEIRPSSVNSSVNTRPYEVVKKEALEKAAREKSECPVCLDGEGLDDIASRCGHVIHKECKECIRAVQGERYFEYCTPLKCPMCRENLEFQ